jgi:hypothetical protein
MAERAMVAMPAEMGLAVTRAGWTRARGHRRPRHASVDTTDPIVSRLQI